MSCDTNFKTYHSGKLSCVRQVPEIRTPDGMLKSPPRILVAIWDPEAAQLKNHQIPWAVAEEFLPDDMAEIAHAITLDRVAELPPTEPAPEDST